MSILLERIQQVIDSRFGGNASKWSVEADMHRSTVGTMKSRLREGSVESAGADTLMALARAAGVSPVWLITGEGEMVDGAAGNASPSAARTSDVPAHDPVAEVLEEALDIEDSGLRRAIRVFVGGKPRDARLRETVLIVKDGKYSGAEKLTEPEWVEVLEKVYAGRSKGRAPMGHGSRRVDQ